MVRQNPMKIADGRFQRSLSGVALIEAMIAMLVMAFGTLALVGVQATLRLNSDIAKQRAEATRIALADLETARNFISVAAVGGKAGVSWDEMTGKTVAAVDQIDGVASTVFSLKRTVTVPTNSLNQKNINVVVSWNDRAGQAQSVTFDSIAAAADPTWSALLNVPSKPSAHAQRVGRHPTIPASARDIGGDQSAFKPLESGTVGWVFNNTTGFITSVCSGTLGPTSSLTASTLGTCTAVADTYLLTGFVNFNLRDAELNLLVTTNSVFKPIAGGTVAWLIDNSSHSITQRCTVSSSSTTARLAAGTDSLTGCVGVSPAQLVSPVDSSRDVSVTLTASDSEAPLWPALNFGIKFVDDTTPVGRIKSTSCFTTAPTSAAAANSQVSAIYYCAVTAEAPDTLFNIRGWGGQVNLLPAGYSDGGSVAWTIGTDRSGYKVCRYTTAATAFTDNLDHPAFYCKVKAPVAGSPLSCTKYITSNLTNQNFLVIAVSKSCPTDTALSPGGSDLVNSNTLQQQP